MALDVERHRRELAALTRRFRDALAAFCVVCGHRFTGRVIVSRGFQCVDTRGARGACFWCEVRGGA